MLIDLNCFKCKNKVSVEIGQEDLTVTKNNRYVVNVTCPAVRPDGTTCGRKMTSLIGKSIYDNILKPEEVTQQV